MGIPIFTITTDDLREDNFRCGGKGGQKQNKTDSGVRFAHEPSGAVGECREERSKAANRKKAFERLGKHPKFVAWCQLKAAAMLEGHASIEKKLDKLMSEGNLVIEMGVDCDPGETVCDLKSQSMIWRKGE